MSRGRVLRSWLLAPCQCPDREGGQSNFAAQQLRVSSPTVRRASNLSIEHGITAPSGSVRLRSKTAGRSGLSPFQRALAIELVTRQRPAGSLARQVSLRPHSGRLSIAPDLEHARPRSGHLRLRLLHHRGSRDAATLTGIVSSYREATATRSG